MLYRQIVGVLGVISYLIGESSLGVASFLGGLFIFQGIRLAKRVSPSETALVLSLGLGLVIFPPLTWYASEFRVYPGDVFPTFLELAGVPIVIGVVLLSRARRLVSGKSYKALVAFSFVVPFFFWDLVLFLRTPQMSIISGFVVGYAALSALAPIYLAVLLVLKRLKPNLETDDRRLRRLIIGGFLILVVGGLLYNYNYQNWVRYEIKREL